MPEPSLPESVRLMGDTLGHVLSAQGGLSVEGGATVFAAVEAMRAAAKESRELDGPAAEAARTKLAEIAASLDDATALDVVRAFTLYFQLVNLAEDQERARVLRQRELDADGAPVPESLADVVDSLHSQGTGLEEILAALHEVHIGFVFTAHPTEARRRTTERLLASARASLSIRDHGTLTVAERRAEDRRLRASIEALWQHASERAERPEVLDEVKAGLWYLRNVLLDQVPRLYRRIAFALERRYRSVDGEAVIDAVNLPSCISFGSWMGGDRDGNPFVTDGVTERTLELHRLIVLERYEADLLELVDPLAATAARIVVTPRLDAALTRAAMAVPEIAGETGRRNPDEPLRRLLTFMRERVARTRTFSSGAYHSPDDLLDDLHALRDALIASGSTALPDDLLLSLVYRVRCFGFHLAALEVREDSRVHRAAIAELLGRADYVALDEGARAALLPQLELPLRHLSPSEATQRVLGLFRTVARAGARFGQDTLHTYIISMTESATDVLEVLRLADLHRVDAALDIAPLLETPADLARAEPLLDALFSDPAYRAHLRRRGDVQELLVGYSDSMKQGGILASRVRVNDAQRAAARACARHGVTLRVFHGRGGSISRGGGPTYRAIGALPREAFGRLKITEQGEMRAYNFANPDLAARYIEQSVGAALLARVEARRASVSRPANEEATLERLAAESQRAYRALVDDPDLVRYFQEATPFASIAALNIASRPAKRKRGELTLDDLRAIPWVFAWSQSRHVLTGWYGVGSALEAIGDAGRADAARLYRESRFVRDLFDNVEMVLAKSDLAIAARYARLTEDPALGARVYGVIAAEHARTVQQVLQVVGRAHLLADDRVLQRSIRLRNPYVDPLSYLQIEAIRRVSALDDPEAKGRWEQVARAAVQGIAAGLRHTG